MSTHNNDDVYDVEAIVGYRHNHGREEYLIKWKGYSEKENTWEPASNLDEGTLEVAKAYCNKAHKRTNPKRFEKPQGRKRRVKRRRRQENDDEFISDDGSYVMSDGTYNEQSEDDDHSRAEKKHVTPSPQRPRRLCSVQTNKRMSKAMLALSSGDDDIDNNRVVNRTGARRKIIMESDDDTISDNEHDNHQGAKLPPFPLSKPNLSSSPTKLRTTSIKCPSTKDAQTGKRLPYPSRSPHVCYIDPDGNRHCYALDTMYRKALENHTLGQKLTFLQPPHFDSPMCEDLEDQIACRFGRQVLKIENSKNYRVYYERYILGLGEHDLYCCPICYNEADWRRGRRVVDDDESSGDEHEEDCFTFDDDPMTILESLGSTVSSTFCFLKVKAVRIHLQHVHSVDLGELKGNDLFKRFMIRSPDGLLQHFVRSNPAYKNDMWGYWRGNSRNGRQNGQLFRNLVQNARDNEEKKPAANQYDFCTSFPKRAKQIWEKVSAPYLNDNSEGEKFINDDNNDSDEEENDVRENPYFTPPDQSEEEETEQYIEDLKRRVQQNKEDRSDDDDDKSSSEDDSEEDEEEDSDEDEEEDSEEDDEDGSEDPWLKEKENKMKQRREKRRSNTKNQDSDDDIMFEFDSARAGKCATFTASDNDE